MLSLTHAAIGGALGEHFANPWFAFGIGVASHVLLDKVPHYFSFEKRLYNSIVGFDALATLIFLFFLYFLPIGNHAGLVWGGVGGVVIDAVLVLGLDGKGKIAEWHTSRQFHHQRLIWLWTDVLLFALGISFIMIFR